MIGAAPAMIFIGHQFFGAALNIFAFVLLSALSVILVLVLLSGQARRRLDRLSPAWLVIGLFAATLAVALMSLTSWAPGGAHPIWSWSGGNPASTINRSATALEIIKLLGLAAPFLIGCIFGAWTESARRLYGLILAIGAVYAIVSLVMFLARIGPLASSRLNGGFESANIAGTLFGVLAVMAAAWSLRAWTRMDRLGLADRVTAMAPQIALGLLFLACLLLTASRAAIGATGLALALFAGWAAFNNRQARWPIMALGLTVIAVAIAVFLQGNTLFIDRFEGLAGDTSRIDLLAPHWQAFLDAPLSGYGLGSFAQVNDQIATSQTAAALSSTVILHNVYVQWLEEAGLVGAIPMFLLIVVVLGVTAWRTFRRPRNQSLLTGLLCASLIVLLHAGVDVSLNTLSFCAFWSLLLGLGFGLSQASSRAD
jgi:O-antigen ligase